MTDTIHAFAGDEPPEIQVHTHDRYHAVMDACSALPPLVTAVVHPVDSNALEAVAEAVRENLIIPLLVGPFGRIKAAAEKGGIDLSSWKIVDAPHSHAAARIAVELAAAGEVHAIMKGEPSIPTNCSYPSWPTKQVCLPGVGSRTPTSWTPPDTTNGSSSPTRS